LQVCCSDAPRTAHNVGVDQEARPTAESSPERLVTFTDAVAAIAMTLLILPLLETISDAAGEHDDLNTLVSEHLDEFAAFALSFAVIFRFWWAHHSLFRHVSALHPPLVAWSVVWTFAIVFLPIPTAIVMAFTTSAGTVALYGGALVLASGSLSMLALYVYRHPEISTGRSPATREGVLGSFSAFVAQILATVVGIVFWESISYWAYLLMFFTAPIESLIRRRWDKLRA